MFSILSQCLSKIVTFHSKVICGQCLLGGFPEDVQAIEFKGPLKFTTWSFWCPRDSHFDEGEQSVYELFEQSVPYAWMT
jgi:hypothetical protein